MPLHRYSKSGISFLDSNETIEKPKFDIVAETKKDYQDKKKRQERSRYLITSTPVKEDKGFINFLKAIGTIAGIIILAIILKAISS